MPTGYTAAIEDGCTFREYAMGCARAFGACVTLRDSPGEDIPEKFEPSNFYVKELARWRAELLRLESMPLDVAIREESSERTREVAKRASYRHEKEEIKARYEAIRPEVAVWCAPTSDHVGLKDFMLQQIDLCLKTAGFHPGYYPEIVRTTGGMWRTRKMAEARKRIRSYKRDHAAEVERAESRTLWVKQLRESLSQTEAIAKAKKGGEK